ncbi:MAG: hypothetical protein CMA07_07195 [Euryarchaeota archaeon]|nr:hypothetical protein [Euryarchaeota archaeon]|tara:strand:+ start:49577 stop:51613 length:2037 start_codon:yes stop_codon:yes gene_type:complete
MATNPYISQKVRSEQHLYEDLVIESLKFYGQDVYYIPREIVNQDKIFGDDIPSRFSDSYKIEMYIENQEGFDGEGDLFTKFGIELRDQATFVVARRRWKSLVGDNLAEHGFRPREGDVIYLPMSESMFEVLKVETETPFYQLSNLPTFRMQCELFEYSDEDFDTDIPSVDAVEYEGAFQYKLTMNTSEENKPVLVPVLTDQGRVESVTIQSAGSGYTSAPTLVTSGVVNASRFGRSALYSNLGHGDEGQYLIQNAEGTVELFIKPTNLPTSGQQALFVTGGDTPQNEMIFGLNTNGRIVYSYSDNNGQSLNEVPNDTIQSGNWTHVLVGHDDNDFFVYVNGTKYVDSASDRTLNLISNHGFSVGAFAAREVDGINYSSFNGQIDEMRALVGDASAIFDSRLTHTTQSYTLTISGGDGADYTFDASQSDRNGEITDLTDPEINVIIGDTLVLDNNSGGHPIEIKDSSDNVVATQDVSTEETTFTPSATGTYTYQCTVSGHENMVGNIVVSAQPTGITVPSSEFDSNSNTALLRHFNGDSAELTAVMDGGSISSITIGDSGDYYTTIPTVTVDAPTVGGQFIIGETVTQDNTSYSIKGEVTRWSDSDRILQLAHVGSTDGTFKSFSTNSKIVGASSSAEWVPKLVEELQQIQNTAQNKIFDDFEGDFLDFSESNPFGDIF